MVGSLAVAVTLLAGSCAPRQPDATTAVRALHESLNTGDYARAMAGVDFRYRLAEALGDLFLEAPETDREAAVALARVMFVNTTETLWKAHYAGRPTQTGVVKHDGPHAWVESVASGDGRPSFTWVYRLTLGEGQWRVTQREYRVGPNRSNTTVFYPMLVKQLAEDLGRMPTLAELNANLPSLRGRVKARTFKVPELPARSKTR